MKVLYHSAPPMADTGYGVHTKNLTSRLKLDHNIAIHSVGGWEGMGIDWDGIQVYPSGAGDHGEQSIPYWFQETDSDIIFSHHDHWSMADAFHGIGERLPTVLYTILDHDLPGKRPPECVVYANENAHKTIVMSEWAEDILTRSRIPNSQIEQIPHGVNTAKYAPVTDTVSKSELKKELGLPEDAFLFGMVAANYGPRKNIPHHMEAFRRLLDDYGAKDAYFYIHSHPKMGGGFDLIDVRDALNLSADRVMFPDPHKKYHGIDDITVVQLYNTFDVHCNVTQSESWGLTITEAMSCGTPVIAANNSAQTEQFGVPYDTYVSEDEGFRVTDQGILVHRGNEVWTQNATARRFTASVDDIYDAMVYYYENRDKVEDHGRNARQWVVDNYRWDYLYENDWKPLFNEIEEEICEPEYNEYYFKRRGKEVESPAFMDESKRISFAARGDTILDVGAGTGKMCEVLNHDGFNVSALEYADYGVEFLERNLSDVDVDIYQGDVRDLDFGDDSFDTVVCQHVLEHINEEVKSVAEMMRVAEERVVIIVPSGSGPTVDDTEERRYHSEDIENLYRKVKGYVDYDFNMEWEVIHPSEFTKNFFITIDT